MRTSLTRIILYAVMMLLLMSLPLPPSIKDTLAAQTTTVVLHPTDDTYIDSSFPGDNYGSSSGLAALSYSFFFGLSQRTEQSWLKFDLSSIPPAATVTSATLTLTLDHTKVNQNVGVYAESSNSWSESTITWNNAPLSSVSSSYTDYNYVTNSTRTYRWNVQSLVASASGSASISLVLQPTSSQGDINGWSVFHSKDGGWSSLGPSLTITYSYVSASISLSDNVIQYGNSVSVLGSTDPVQTLGIMTLQYSVDQYTWSNIASQTGGTYIYSWQPPSTGTFYLRAQWSISWSGGSYTSTSSIKTLRVSKIPVMMMISAPTSAKIGETIDVIATLRDSYGNPMSGCTVTFTFDSRQIGQINTNPSGVASLAYKLSVSPGTYVIKASYGGSQKYEGAENSVSVSVNPLKLVVTSSITQAPLINVNGVDYVTDPSGKVIISISSIGTYALRVNSPLLLSPGTRSVFQQWGDGATSPLRTVVMDSDQTFSVYTKIQYYLNVDANGGIVSGENWYDGGSTAIVNATSPCNVVQGRSRSIFSAWSGDSTSTSTAVALTMDSPKRVIANWKTQYYLQVLSECGNPEGEGWYDAGSIAAISVAGTVVSKDFFNDYVFKGWFNEHGDVVSTATACTVTVDSPAALKASWATELNWAHVAVVFVSFAVLVTGSCAYLLTRSREKILPEGGTRIKEKGPVTKGFRELDEALKKARLENDKAEGLIKRLEEAHREGQVSDVAYEALKAEYAASREKAKTRILEIESDLTRIGAVRCSKCGAFSRPDSSKCEACGAILQQGGLSKRKGYC